MKRNLNNSTVGFHSNHKLRKITTQHFPKIEFEHRLTYQKGKEANEANVMHKFIARLFIAKAALALFL